jgi:hypothetical protein
MLADEITTDLRNIRQQAITRAGKSGHSVTLPLSSKGINYGSIAANLSGSVDTSLVQGVDPDLRVKPFLPKVAPSRFVNLLWVRCTKRWVSKLTIPISPTPVRSGGHNFSGHVSRWHSG